MAETLVQRYLRRTGSLADLAELYGIKAIRGTRYPNLVTLKYSQINSPMAEPLVRECRGIVLDQDDDWRCVARGFDKFFNYGEPLAASIDWSTASVQEKLDGSLILVYWYDGDWRCATTGHPEAGGPGGDYAGTFADLFWRTLGKPFPANVGTYTYLFELCAPENRVVVRHEQARVVMLGARNRETGQEASPASVRIASTLFDIPAVRSFPLQSIDDITATFATLDPLAQEGYVVVDSLFRRVKVKHPGYVALHHLRYSTSTRSLVDVVRKGETLELLSAFPELLGELESIRSRFDEYVGEIESDYHRLHAIGDQKAFALEATKTVCPGALFALRKGHAATVRDYLATVHLDGLIRALGLRETAMEVSA